MTTMGLKRFHFNSYILKIPTKSSTIDDMQYNILHIICIVLECLPTMKPNLKIPQRKLTIKFIFSWKIFLIIFQCNSIGPCLNFHIFQTRANNYKLPHFCRQRKCVLLMFIYDCNFSNVIKHKYTFDLSYI